MLHGCETWSLTLREECRLRVIENMILRRILGPKRDENGERRRLHNKELPTVFRLSNIIGVIYQEDCDAHAICLEWRKVGVLSTL